MKRATFVLCALTVLGLLTVPRAASADASLAVANCNGYTLVSAQYVTTPAGFPYGAVQLCRNGDDFFVIFIHYVSYPPPVYGPMPTGYFGNALLYRYTNGVYSGRWDCSSGNGVVLPGQTWCVTQQVDLQAGDTFKAQGAVDRWDGSKWVLAASGWTQRCNTTTCTPQ
jgi:hypothetical protein